MPDKQQFQLDDPVRSAFADDPDYSELLEEFVEALPEHRETLQQLFQSANIAQLQTLAHQLKGAGGGYGFAGLSETAAKLETACKSGNVRTIAENLEQLVNYLSRIAI